MNSPCSSKIMKISKPRVQTPSLPSSLLNYIFKNADYLLIRQLFSTCKYFPKRYMIQVLAELSVVQPAAEKEGAVMEYSNKSLRLSIQHSKAAKLKNLYIVTSFSYHDSWNLGLCKFLLPKIHRCEAKFIDIWNQQMTWRDFQKIVLPDHIQQLYLEDVMIYDEDRTKIFPLDKLMDHCKNAISFTVNSYKGSNIIFTNKTSSILADFCFTSKLNTFCIGGLTEELDPADFCTFMIKNAAPKSSFTLSFKSKPSHQYLVKLENKMEVALNLWKSPKNKPAIELKY